MRHLNTCFLAGFTLAELLVALAILGVIATFTIPKVLSAQAGEESRAKVKEAASVISGAYQAYTLDHAVTAGNNFADFLPYVNYIWYKYNGETSIDPLTAWNTTAQACDTADGKRCIKMHNGSVIQFYDHNFGSTGTLNALFFIVDPDGQAKGTLESSSVELYLYFNGRITDDSGIADNTCNSFDCSNNDPTLVPAWFHW